MSNLESRHYSVLARSRSVPARPPVVRTTTLERPLVILWAEYLLYFASMVWLLRLILEFFNGTPLQLLLIPAILLAVQVMLITGATHSRSRMLLACMVLFCVGTILLDLIGQAIQSKVYRWEPPRWRFSILRMAQMGLEVLAFAFIFSSGRGRRWFGSARTRGSG